MKKDRKDSGTFILTQNLRDGSIPFYHDETKTMESTSYLVNKKFTVESK
jgi:hypothetical protein